MKTNDFYTQLVHICVHMTYIHVSYSDNHVTRSLHEHCNIFFIFLLVF